LRAASASQSSPAKNGCALSSSGPLAPMRSSGRRVRSRWRRSLASGLSAGHRQSASWQQAPNRPYAARRELELARRDLLELGVAVLGVVRRVAGQHLEHQDAERPVVDHAIVACCFAIVAARRLAADPYVHRWTYMISGGKYSAAYKASARLHLPIRTAHSSHKSSLPARPCPPTLGTGRSRTTQRAPPHRAGCFPASNPGR
jgi:hypothetical protein